MDENVRRKVCHMLGSRQSVAVGMLGSDGWPRVATVGFVSEGLHL